MRTDGVERSNCRCPRCLWVDGYGKDETACRKCGAKLYKEKEVFDNERFLSSKERAIRRHKIFSESERNK